MSRQRPLSHSAFVVLLSIVALVWTSCKKNKDQIDGYSRDNSGFYYKLLAIGDGNEKPVPGEVLLLDAVFRTQSDSIFWDSRNEGNNAFYLELKNNVPSGTFNPYLMKMVEGDSASFYVHTATFFKAYFDSPAPAFCAHDSLVKINLRLVEINTAAEYLQVQNAAEEVEDKELEELSLINDYLKDGKKGVVDGNGIYHLEYSQTNGTPVAAGKLVKVMYTGSFLDGRIIDVAQKPLEFTYGTPDQLVTGLNIVIGTMKKGESAKIILPSRLAFGEHGSGNGSIPPYSPLLYSIEIIDVK